MERFKAFWRKFNNWIDGRIHPCVDCGESTRHGYLLFHDGTRKCLACCGVTRKGCGQPLLLENAWMTDGCPCNSPLGCNNQNETRWRLLMNLQQQQSRNDERYRLLRVAAVQDGFAANADEFDRKCDEALTKR